MREGVDEPVADVVQQQERRGEDVPTVPTQIAPDIDAETARKQHHHRNYGYRTARLFIFDATH